MSFLFHSFPFQWPTRIEVNIWCFPQKWMRSKLFVNIWKIWTTWTQTQEKIWRTQTQGRWEKRWGKTLRKRLTIFQPILNQSSVAKSRNKCTFTCHPSNNRILHANVVFLFSLVEDLFEEGEISSSNAELGMGRRDKYTICINDLMAK